VTAIEIALLAASGFVAGITNAVAGGGTFFTFPSMVFFGMSPLGANATSAIALVPGSFATAAAYWRDTRHRWRELVPLAFLGAAGGVAGALLLIGIGDEGFRPLVPWLLLLATLAFAFNSRIRALVVYVQGAGTLSRTAGFLLLSVVAIYGGFFGAGMGIMLLGTLAVVQSGDFHRINAAKNIIAMLSQTTAVVLFIVGGLVHWPQAMIVTATAIVGGYLGVTIARRVPETVVRAVVVAVGAMLSLIFFLR
jgi:uncharacterized membrane protein YfcA